MIQWAEQQCRKEQHVSANKEQHVTANDEQLRKALGDLIYLIRFPIMKRKYFTSTISTKNVLTLEEKVEIYQSFDGKVIDTFSTNVRLFNLNKNISWNNDGVDECLHFTTNFDCYIYEIFVFRSNQYSGKHEVNINILNDSAVLDSTSTQLNSVVGKQYYEINLANPLRILNNIRYTIKLNMKVISASVVTNYKTIVKIDNGSTFTFTDSALSLHRTNSISGQIPGIILSRSYIR
jgi:hypothetical protein